jgi:hypothetical protein
MASMRDNPRRPTPAKRPTWLIGVIVAVAVLVVIGLIFGVMNLFKGGGETAAADAAPESSASPCVTQTLTTSEVLPDPSEVKINVYNSTSKTGLAKETAQSLSQRGFKILKVANDPEGKKIAGVAQIRYGPKGEASAKLLLLYVPGADMINDYRTSKRIDLSTGKTFSGLSPQQGVNALLAAPTPVASGAGCLPQVVLPESGQPSAAPSAA